MNGDEESKEGRKEERKKGPIYIDIIELNIMLKAHIKT